MGIINELGPMGIASRLQRMSDSLRKDTAAIYKKYDSNFTMKWYPVIIVLSRKPSVSLAELATELLYAHPSVIQLINEMEKEKLVRSASHKKDARKRMVSLTQKGAMIMEEIAPFVSATEQAIIKLIKTENNLLKALEEVEVQLNKESFFKRVDKILEKETITTASQLN